MRVVRKYISKIGDKERQEISDLIENNIGLIFHEIEFNQIVSDIFQTELSYYVAYSDLDKIVGCCPLHSIKNKLVKHTYSNPSIFEIPYGGWVFDKTHIQLGQLLEKTKPSLNESLFYWSTIQIENNDYKDIKFEKSNKYNPREFLTAIIDLHQPEDDIINRSVSQNTRHNIKRASKKGVTVEEITPENYSVFINSVNSLREKLGLKKVKKDLYFELVKHYYKRNKIKILAAKYENEYLSAVMNIGNKNVTHAWIAGRASDIPNNLYQNELLWWESIKWAKKNGSRYYDLCVIEKERLPNIAQFKMGFSKNLVPFYYIIKKPMILKNYQSDGKMVLGYYKFVIKEAVIQFIAKIKFRKNNHVGKKCYLANDLILKGNIRIGDYCHLGKNICLEKNVHIGNFATLANIEISENSFIESGVVCTGFGKGKIEIGKESYIGLYDILDFSDSITIGNYVHIAGPSTGLWTHFSSLMCLNNIPLKNKDIKFRPTAPITVEDNVYIGGNCTIYPGITVGHHSIVAPNSAVTKNVKPYTLVGGVPAKFIKKIVQNDKE